MNFNIRLVKIFLLYCITFASVTSIAQVPYERILNSNEEPENWLTYNGGYIINI